MADQQKQKAWIDRGPQVNAGWLVIGLLVLMVCGLKAMVDQGSEQAPREIEFLHGG